MSAKGLKEFRTHTGSTRRRCRPTANHAQQQNEEQEAHRNDSNDHTQTNHNQESNVGLMKAGKRFNPDMIVRLVSVSVHWIRAEFLDYYLLNLRIV